MDWKAPIERARLMARTAGACLVVWKLAIDEQSR